MSIIKWVFSKHCLQTRKKLIQSLWPKRGNNQKAFGKVWRRKGCVLCWLWVCAVHICRGKAVYTANCAQWAHSRTLGPRVSGSGRNFWWNTETDNAIKGWRKTQDQLWREKLRLLKVLQRMLIEHLKTSLHVFIYRDM